MEDDALDYSSSSGPLNMAELSLDNSDCESAALLVLSTIGSNKAGGIGGGAWI